ncbi:MAG: AraC family transcriptional regulator [Acidobacteriaceae bacterium]|nr:AraC family transcriptional regulator [Acidobacteriaceae bacterium]
MRAHCGEALFRAYQGQKDTGEPPILATRSLQCPQLATLSVMAGQKRLGLTGRLPVEDTFLVGVSITGVSNHEVLSKGRSWTKGGFAADSTRIYQLDDELQIDIREPYQIVDFVIPRASLDALTRDDGRRRVRNISCPYGVEDQTMAGMARALLPYFARPQEASPFFVDSAGLTVTAHLADRYGDSVRPQETAARGGLTRAQVLRVQEMLAANLKGNLHVADIARECAISWQHLIREFKATAGCTPFRWLQRRRVDLAKDLLRRTDLPLGDIALQCGFADQRHLTRVFHAMAGTTPAIWREQNQS